MEITKATEKDIPDIVALLKISLGESLMPKSEIYWRWKHILNPFGVSPVLLCREDQELIGVRAFMRWQWMKDGQRFSAVRAVDTATHPSHQGKGIFKKLTLALVESCKQDGDHFVFNTPNKQSMPGYLKMEWKQAGKLPLQIGVQRPIAVFRNVIIQKRHVLPDFQDDSLKEYLAHPGLNGLIVNHCNQQKAVTTPVSVDYLNWRYVDVPVARYVAVGQTQGDELTGLIIGRIKESRMGREFRVTDFFLKQTSSIKELAEKLKQLKKKYTIDYTTCSGAAGIHAKKLLGTLSLNASMGPIVTIRPLSMQNLEMLTNFDQWSPSLGDLELF